MNLTWQESSNIEASLIDFIKDEITAKSLTLLDRAGTPQTINVYAGREVQKDWQLPLIQIYIDHHLSTRLELGSHLRIKDYYIIVDVRTELSGQEINLADWVSNFINDGFPYYEYSVDSLHPDIPVKNLVSTVNLDFFTSNALPLFDDADIFDQNRFRIVIKAWIN